MKARPKSVESEFLLHAKSGNIKKLIESVDARVTDEHERDDVLYRWLWICHGFGHSDAAEWADDMLETSSFRYDDEQITVGHITLELAELYLVGDDHIAANRSTALSHLKYARTLQVDVTLPDVFTDLRDSLTGKARATWDSVFPSS